MKLNFGILLVLILCFLTAQRVSAAYPARSSNTVASSFENAVEWGKAIDGLQISISTVDSQLSENSQLQIGFQNSGESDRTLNIGIMLANGKIQMPENISLVLTDTKGKAHVYKYLDIKHAVIAGRIDDYIVPLREGSMYIIRIRFDQFYCFETNGFLSKISGGQYHLSAHYEGSGAKAVNLDMPGIKLMNFWLGKLESNDLVISK